MSSTLQKKPSRENSIYAKEVILLPDPATDLLPRRAQRAWLFENGHVKSAVEFNTGWNEARVKQAIKESFAPILDDCR